MSDWISGSGRWSRATRRDAGFGLDGDTEEATRRYREIMERDRSSPVAAENRFNSFGYQLMGGGRLRRGAGGLRAQRRAPPLQRQHPRQPWRGPDEDRSIRRGGRQLPSSLELDPGNRNADAMIEKMTGPTD